MLTGNVRQPSTVIWFHILKLSRSVHRIHLFLHLMQLGSDLLNCLVIFFLTFALRRHPLVFLGLSSFNPFRTYFGFEYFGELFSFADNSSCSRTCSRSDSTNPYCASCNANLCSSVCRCSSPMHLLRDSTWSSCFARSDLAWLSKWSLLPSRRDPLKFDGLALLNTEFLIRFPCSNEDHASGVPEAFWVSDEWDLKLSFQSARLYCAFTSLSPAWPLHRVSPKLSGRTVVKSASFRNSPPSRSESAMLSTESSKCICDWM